MWMCERCQEINDDSAQACKRCKAPTIARVAMAPAGASAQAPPRRGPILVDTQGAFEGGRAPYRIEGELVPVLTISLSQLPIYFEHYVLLWKTPSVEISLKPLKGLGRRILSGMPILMTQAAGEGDIAFSRDGSGHIFPVHLRPGQEIDVREHQFLAATDSVDYTFVRVKGMSNMLLGGTGFFIDKFTGRGADAIVWIHGYGNVFEINLAPGEILDVEPGGWIYKDPTVGMQTIGQPLAIGLLASAASFTFNRFTGPGRLGIQSMYLPAETAN
jgi:uncharacterized protein (AIM24 family)